MSKFPGSAYVYRQNGYSWGNASLSLHGNLLSVTICGHHRIISEYYDIRCVTHQFGWHINTRWAVRNILVALALVFACTPAYVLPEHIGKYIVVPFALLAMSIVFVTFVSVFFFRRTLRLRAYTCDATRRIEFNYRPKRDLILDRIVACSELRRRRVPTPTPLWSVRLVRDWLAAFPLRFALNWLYIVYECAKYSMYCLVVLVMIFLFFQPDFKPPEFTLPEPVAEVLPYFLISIPALTVLVYLVRAAVRNEGPWLNRSLRRRVLHAARTRGPEEVVPVLQDAVFANLHDTESRFLLVQLHVAAGRFEHAIAHIRELREIAPEECQLWLARINYLKSLGDEDVAKENEFEELVNELASAERDLGP